MSCSTHQTRYTDLIIHLFQNISGPNYVQDLDNNYVIYFLFFSKMDYLIDENG